MGETSEGAHGVRAMWPNWRLVCVEAYHGFFLGIMGTMSIPPLFYGEYVLPQAFVAMDVLCALRRATEESLESLESLLKKCLHEVAHQSIGVH